MWKILLNLRQFTELMKFGIIFGNLIPLVAGFVLAGGDDFFKMLLAVLFASGVIACGCVINNCIDIDIDKLMERTKNRPLPLGKISPNVALIFGFFLGLGSLPALYYFVGFYSFLFALIGLFSYIVLYTILTKRQTTFGVHVGSISGAIPPVIGYCAVKNPDLNIFLFFLCVAIWQMPHSFAIHAFRNSDYTKAKIKTLPNIFGLEYTAKSMLVYVIIYTILSLVLFVYNKFYLLLPVLILCNLYWLRKTLAFQKTLELKHARKSFFASILNMMVISLLIILDKLFL